jgi:hypothetical protein
MNLCDGIQFEHETYELNLDGKIIRKATLSQIKSGEVGMYPAEDPTTCKLGTKR